MKIHYRGLVAAVVIPGFVVLTLALSPASASVSAADRNKQLQELHVTKECSEYAGAAGQFCTIASSNVPEIKVGTKVFYDQAAGIPAGLLDSNVVLDAGRGNRAVGRCTLDFRTAVGLCTFSDGTGQFAGFHARVDVSYLGVYDGKPLWAWDGAYRVGRKANPDR
jgi:hypothetical protein